MMESGALWPGPIAGGPARHALRSHSQGSGGSARRIMIGRSVVAGQILSPRPRPDIASRAHPRSRHGARSRCARRRMPGQLQPPGMPRLGGRSPAELPRLNSAGACLGGPQMPFVLVGALGLGQPRSEDPHQLRHRLRAHLGPRVCQVVLDGRVRQAEAVGGRLLRPGRPRPLPRR
jgi:hypothetical protein